VGRRVTQEEVVERLKEEGYRRLSIRTLSAWRSAKLLPPMQREGREKGTYEESILDTIRLLALTSPYQTKPNETLLSYSREDGRVDVVSIQVLRLNNTIKMYAYLREGGFILMNLEEGDLDAITRLGEDDNVRASRSAGVLG
jgi:hypothetical protein